MEEFSYGKMLKLVRESWRFTQDDLAIRMEKLVSDKRGVRRKNAIRTSISQMETGVRQFRPELIAAAATVLNIPDSWFYYPMPSMESVEKNLAKLRVKQNPTRKASLTSVAKELPKPQQPSSLPDPNEFFREPGRDQLLKAAVKLLISPGPALVAIKGLSGYGKSSFASLLVSEALKADSRTRLAIAISCRNRSTEQIETAIRDAIGQIDGRLRGRALAEVVRVIPTILVLDDFYHPSSQSAPAMAGELASRLSSAFEKGGGLKLVVTGGVGSSRQPLLESLKRIVGETRSMDVALGELSQTDVVWFLVKGMRIDSLTARSAARSLGGDPIKIGAYVSAHRVAPISPPELLAMTRRINQSKDAGNKTKDPRSQELEELVGQLCDFGSTTYLTGAVLALSQSGLSIENCVKLVRGLITQDGLKVSSIDSNDAIMDVRTALGKPLHPFINHDTHTVELHARVKMALVRSVPRILGEEGARTIHRRLAEAALSRLPSAFSRSFVPTTANLADFQDMLQHMMDLYYMAPDLPVPVGADHFLPSKSDSPFDPAILLKLLDDPIAIRSRYSIANTTFHTVMLSRVGKDNDERMLTRQFGDFEQKLSLLSHFLVDRELGDPDRIEPIPELRPEFASHVLLDVAVCANQAGLIEIAHGAIRRRQRYRGSESTGTMFARILDILRGPNWIDHADISELAASLEADSEHINVYVSVLLREGELSHAETFVDRYASKAVAVVAALEQHRVAYTALTKKVRRHINSLLLSCRRLMAKRGQVLANVGRMDAALLEFEQAINAEDFRRGGVSDGPAVLSGETGRSFCIALAVVGGEKNLATAAACIEYNIQKATSSLRTYDMLDWYTLQAALFRLRGDPAAAEESLKKAEMVRREDGVALSFVSLVTLAIEQERQKLRRNGPRFNSGKLNAIHGVAESSRHRLLACDAALLLAEASIGRDRTQYLQAARLVIQGGYGFRSADAEILSMDQTSDHLI
ncbi:hypothetical protein DEM27_24110 [Metarhizobium album]|uniref:HTH cro/C1-type domain-containing protein n=1 Tax=Metarhizobium album TaxID=2182425 RepID=A0A2U2DJZ2_9HYPH|nr:helix-turn-helix transcriptional regulator [Rhizobium album]PWE53637.1 hypothetical protein DEM27_24110 [Rhizobium album]